MIFFFKFKLGSLNGTFSSLLLLNIFLPTKFQFFTFDKIRYCYYGTVSVQLQNVRTEVEISNFNLENSNFKIRNYKVGISTYMNTSRTCKGVGRIPHAC